MKYHVSVAALVACAGTAAAQFSITPAGANAGNGNFSNVVIPAGPTGAGMSGANFRPTTTTSTDSLFAHAWWYRANDDTREYTFATSAASPAISGVTVGNNVNTLGTGGYDFTVTNAGYSFTAQLRYTIVAGAAGPTTNYTCSITNTGASQLDISLFSYGDIDANAVLSNTYAINGAGNTFQVSSGATLLEFRGNNPAAYQAQIFATLRNLLADALVTNLANTVTGSPGDFTGAFQWNLQIAPAGTATVGGSFAFVSSFNPPPCYANCDGSTGTPALTANDFQCFINEYANQTAYANCDGSTGTPALTANDFQCFINKYAAGCS